MVPTLIRRNTASPGPTSAIHIGSAVIHAAAMVKIRKKETSFHGTVLNSAEVFVF
ncbi:hypothetical protein [Streptosporangium sandarakinum]|uniref:hypothetical protein n=1 Tax=Streptosporangium sandarakinum TaxID=1260955 RepID=UPI0037132980